MLTDQRHQTEGQGHHEHQRRELRDYPPERSIFLKPTEGVEPHFSQAFANTCNPAACGDLGLDRIGPTPHRWLFSIARWLWTVLVLGSAHCLNRLRSSGAVFVISPAPNVITTSPGLARSTIASVKSSRKGTQVTSR